MTIVDSSGWLEYFKEDVLADAYEPHVLCPDVLVPVVVLYEVYKVLLRDLSRRHADVAASTMKSRQVVALDEVLAIEAAEISLEHGLAMADAIIYATAQYYDALLITSDEHFAGLPGVEYLPRPPDA